MSTGFLAFSIIHCCPASATCSCELAMASAVSFAFLQAEELMWWSLIAVSALGYSGYYLRKVVKVSATYMQAFLPRLKYYVNYTAPLGSRGGRPVRQISAAACAHTQYAFLADLLVRGEPRPNHSGQHHSVEYSARRDVRSGDSAARRWR